MDITRENIEERKNVLMNDMNAAKERCNLRRLSAKG